MTIGELSLHGRPHHLMQADLTRYPPIFDGDVGMVLTRRNG
jgi:hypothetical protein